MPTYDSSEIKDDETAVYSSESRRNSLAISALLNEVPIDPLHHPLAPNYNRDNTSNHENIERHRFLPLPLPQPTDYFNTPHYSSASSSSASSPSGSLDSRSRQSSVNHEPPDLWNHSRTGLHKTNSGNIVVSSLAKAKRKRILPHQYQRLMETFESTDTPSSEIREQLAEELDMTKREVQVWFQNRRAKVSRNRQRRNSGRHHSFTTLHRASYTEEDSPRRRDSEYSQPYVKSIAPKRSSSFNMDDGSTQPSYIPNTTTHTTTTINNINHASRNMVLEAPYHPPNLTTNNSQNTSSIERQESAIDILASAAEMMRP
ncbi:MAG: homeobox domain-containing protein [Benjaminiella poitrasii]|nr:MAG: homeobox domain-containing protein [Benjaminiella poitrasii]